MPKLPEIAVTPTGFEIDGKTIAFDEVTSVGYLKQVRRASGLVNDVIRTFELRVGDRKVGVKLDGATVLVDEKNERWGKLVAASQQSVEPRLRQEALDRIRAGEPVTVGRLELGQDGFGWRTPIRPKRYGWPDFYRAFYENCRIKVFVQTDGDKAVKVGELDTDQANAVLLPQLMPACVEAFSA